MRRRTRITPLLLALLVALAGITWLLSRRNQPLLSYATPINTQSRPFGPYHEWLSAEEVLGTCSDHRGFCLLNTRTGRETPLTAFNEKWGKELSAQVGMGLTALLSPNGEWLLWRSLRGDRRENERMWIAAEINGRRHVTGKISSNGNWWGHHSWMPDGKGWVEMRRQENGRWAVRIVSIERPGTFSEVTVPGANVHAGNYAVLGFNDTGQILVYTTASNSDRPPFSQFNLIQFDLHAPTGSARQFALDIPGVNWAYPPEVALSRKGNRIAVLIHANQEPSPFTQFLRRWLPFLPRPSMPVPKDIQELWMCEKEGKRRRKIGFYRRKTGFDPASVPIRYVQWTPDGKRLSFVHNGILYTVPAD